MRHYFLWITLGNSLLFCCLFDKEFHYKIRILVFQLLAIVQKLSLVFVVQKTQKVCLQLLFHTRSLRCSEYRWPLRCLLGLLSSRAGWSGYGMRTSSAYRVWIPALPVVPSGVCVHICKMADDGNSPISGVAGRIRWGWWLNPHWMESAVSTSSFVHGSDCISAPKCKAKVGETKDISSYKEM